MGGGFVPLLGYAATGIEIGGAIGRSPRLESQRLDQLLQSLSEDLDVFDARAVPH